MNMILITNKENPSQVLGLPLNPLLLECEKCHKSPRTSDVGNIANTDHGTYTLLSPTTDGIIQCECGSAEFVVTGNQITKYLEKFLPATEKGKTIV